MTARKLLLLALAAALLAVPATAGAKVTSKKAIWGPVEVLGVSQFPIYADLGAGIWLTQISWNGIAPTKPANPRDPKDPAYQWPERIDLAVSEARKYGIRIGLQIFGAPPWANGGHPESDPPLNYAPKKPSDFADFLRAAAKRWPSVHIWLIWGEPSRRANWKPGYRERRGKRADPQGGDGAPALREGPRRVLWRPQVGEPQEPRGRRHDLHDR